MKRRWSIWLGWEPREAEAFAVARHSIRKRLHAPIPIYGLVLDDLRERGLYTRPTQRKLNSEGRWQLWDEISQAPCSTEFSISRFLVPHLAGDGLALFMDCDMLVRTDLSQLFRAVEYSYESKAIWCVKHHHEPNVTVKMDGQTQTKYARKNWSSVMLFDCDHTANKSLTVDLVNTVPGRDLHGFCWLKDNDIGELPLEWNWLAGESEPIGDPKIVHHTLGSPCMAGYEGVPFAEEWRAELNSWAR